MMRCFSVLEIILAENIIVSEVLCPLWLFFRSIKYFGMILADRLHETTDRIKFLFACNVQMHILRDHLECIGDFEIQLQLSIKLHSYQVELLRSFKESDRI